jgi:uracil-DNA glycosylase
MSPPAVFSKKFVARLAKLKFRDVFNPYSDICPSHDDVNAPQIRRKNLESVLERALSLGVDSMWVGLELGYGGGRRTGLAMTDDARLVEHASLYSAKDVKRATASGPVSEITAGAVWEAVRLVGRPVFLWNIFPLHPHQSGVSLSNRRHTRLEREACADLLEDLLAALNPKLVIALGREAQNALTGRAISQYPVRHPAYGGKPEFISGIKTAYRIG